MLIRDIITKEEKQHTEFFPQTSFPSSGPSAEWLTVNGFEEVIPPAPEVYVPTYQDKRRELYAPLQEQLDMQYKDAINGTTTWVDHITFVKTSIPKPE